MEAIILETKDDKFLITLDKNSFSQEFVMQIVDRLRMENLAEKVAFADDIENLGEEIKADWWNNNKSRLLGTK
jgi:hypothetical protein